MQKKKIVHVIDDLGRGGAETLLVDLLPDLSEEYEIILITLGDKIDFDPQQIVCKERLCLNYKGLKDILPAAQRLRKIIQQYQPDIVRSQLYWSTIVTRLACSKDPRLFFSVHATMNEDPISWYKKYFLKTLEKLTYRKSQKMIGVTQAVIDSFVKIHPGHGHTFLLHNFVRDVFFTKLRSRNDNDGVLKVVSVGNLRLIKNMPYLLEAVRTLPKEKIVLDIYGEGAVREEMDAKIKDYGLLNVRLMGRRNDIYNVLSDYDVYVSSSTVEGFGIAVAEAMSVGLPVIISDIPVYREIGGRKALYLDQRNPESLRKILADIIEGKMDLQALGKANKDYAANAFSKKGYLTKLRSIYETAFD